MNLLARRVGDKRVLKLVRGYLNAGVLGRRFGQDGGGGTPQGGPLSPLLSNIVLDRLDKELERRGHRFVRYADDCNVYVKSERAGQRVLESIGAFIEKKLRLKLNREKSAVGRPSERKFLGSAYGWQGAETADRAQGPEAPQSEDHGTDAPDPGGEPGTDEQGTGPVPDRMAGLLRILPNAVGAEGTGRMDPAKVTERPVETVEAGPHTLQGVKGRGVAKDLAAQTAGSSHGPWRISKSPALNYALPNVFFTKLGLPTLAPG